MSRFLVVSLATFAVACGGGASSMDGGVDAGTCLQPDAVVGDPATTPKVYFNHSYTIVSQATADALQTNAYLKDTFVDVEVRTTVRPDMTYTATYLNLERTYLEYFPKGTFGLDLGYASLALGVEAPGSLVGAQTKLAGEFGSDGGVSEVEQISRTTDAGTNRWFDLIYPAWDSNAASLGLFMMEYVPDAGATAPRTRQQERALRYAPTKLAKDVTAVIYGADATDLPLMRRALSSLGWRVTDTLGGFRAVSHRDDGVGRALTVLPATAGRGGMVAVRMSLNQAASHTETLGDAVLEVGVDGPTTATLWFAPPTDQDRGILNRCE